ncbi:MAG: hypothetical protein EBQ56_13190, partial [Proteobacteria bacterium]|nr:hypothetical protein [Pseudomonadota bacterium]
CPSLASCGAAVLGEPLCVHPSAPSLVTAATVSGSACCATGFPPSIGSFAGIMSLARPLIKIQPRIASLANGVR